MADSEQTGGPWSLGEDDTRSLPGLASFFGQSADRWVEAYCGHPDRGIWSIAAESSGSALATVSSSLGDSVVHLWDVARWEVVARICPEQEAPYVRSMAFSPGGRLLALDAGELWIYDVAVGCALLREPSLVGPLGWMPRSSAVLAFTADGELVSLDVGTGERRSHGRPPIGLDENLSPHPGLRQHLSVRSSPDGSEIALTGRVQEPGGYSWATVLKASRGGWQILEDHAALTWTPWGERRLLQTARRELWLERARRGAMVRYQAIPLAVPDGAIEQLAWSPSAQKLAVALAMGEVSIVDAQTGQVRSRVGTASERSRSSLSWVGEHHLALAPELSVWDTRPAGLALAAAGARLPTWASRSAAPRGKPELVARPEPSLLGVILQQEALGVVIDSSIHRLDLRSGEILPALRSAPKGPVRAKGALLAYSTPDRGVAVADLLGEPVQLGAHAATIETLAWSPAGEHLASGSVDGALRLWEASSGREIFCASPDEDVLSPQGSRPSPREVRENGSSATGAPRALFSPEGTRLAWSDPGRPGVRILELETAQAGELPVEASSVGPWMGEDRLLCRRYADASQPTLTLWDVRGQPLVHCDHKPSWWVGASAQGGWVVLAAHGGTELALWHPERGSAVRRLSFDEPLLDAPRIQDARTATTHHQGGTLRVWDIATGTVHFEVKNCRTYALSCCRQQIVAAVGEEILWLRASDGGIVARHPVPAGERPTGGRPGARGWTLWAGADGQVVAEHARGATLYHRDKGAIAVIKPSEQGFLGRGADGALYLHGGGSLVEVIGQGGFARLARAEITTSDPSAFLRALARGGAKVLPISTL